MSRRPTVRAVSGLALSVGLAVTLLPRHLPRSTPLTDPSAEAVELVSFGLRCVATVMAGYVALVLLAVVAGSLRLLPEAVGRFVDHWTGNGVAGAVRRAIGVSAVAVGLTPIAPALAETSTPPVLAPVEARGEVRTGPMLTPTPSDREPIERPPDPQPDGAPTTITVAPGESFWSLAAAMTTDALGRPPTDAEIVPRWTALIAANQDRLVDPDDPDLILPGQVLRLP